MNALIVVMGVSGSGKSDVGLLLAERFGVSFADADDEHPRLNREKMARGIALSDADREPWLRRVGEIVAEAESTDRGLVIACSALKRAYRMAILNLAPATRFVFLKGSPELISARLAARRDHFMPPSLLASQFEALEPLAPDEPGVTVEIEPPAAAVADAAFTKLTAKYGYGMLRTSGRPMLDCGTSS